MNQAKEKIFEGHVMAFYAALANVFMPEEERMDVPQIEMKNGDDFNEIVAAMMIAEMNLFARLASNSAFDGEDMIGFTHILNRIAIQHCFMQDDETEDDKPTLTMMKDGQAADEENGRAEIAPGEAHDPRRD